MEFLKNNFDIQSSDELSDIVKAYPKSLQELTRRKN